MMFSGLARAFERGLRASVAVLVLAIAGIVFFPQIEGERFATAAYLAAIFAAVMLIALRCIPEPERVRADYAERSIAGSIAFWFVVAAVLAASVLAAGSLDREVAVGISCTIAVIAAAVFPTGIVELVRQRLSKGGGLFAIARYAVVTAVAAFALQVYAHVGDTLAAVFGFVIFALACTLELATSRPIREFLAGTSLATAIAFAIAACVPSFAQTAAAVGYTAAVYTMALLVFRASYA